MIIIANYSNVSVRYTANGTQTVFSFPFDYLRKAFVYVEVNEETILTQGTDYNVSGKTVVFATAPASGTVLRIYRSTDTTPLVSWADASVLRAKDMTLQQIQDLHILEEQDYWTRYNAMLRNGDTWDARGFQIKDVADPTDPTDAVNKEYLEAEAIVKNSNDTYWVGQGLPIKNIGEPTDNSDVATKQYADNNFMRLDDDGTTWVGRGLPVRNIATPGQTKDATTKEYVDNLIDSLSVAADRYVVFDTVAAMVAADLPAGYNTRTLGYHDINDGGAGTYSIRGKVAGETENGGSVIFLDNENVAELITDGTVNVKQFGAKGDGVTDDTTALTNAINSGYAVYIPKGHFVCTSTIDNTIGLTMFGDGNESVIDAKSDGRIYCKGSLTQIADISNVSAGSTTVTFTSAHGLDVGDVFCIYAPNTLWSEWRDYYNAGEWCEVQSVNGLTVTLVNSLVDSYLGADVQIWKMNSVPVEMHDFRMVGETQSTILRVSWVKNAKFRNIGLQLVSLIGMQVNKSYNVLLENLNIINTGTGDTTDYGLQIANSQFVTVIGGSYCGGRHGISTGGDNQNCNVTCRYIKVYKARLSNVRTTGSTAADTHGNTEFAVYEQCYIDGGVSFRGQNLMVKNCDIVSRDGGDFLFLGEVNGGYISVEGCRCISYANPYNNSHGAYFNLGVDGDSNSKAKKDINFIIKNCDIELNGVDGASALAFYRNKGATVKKNFEISGINLKNIGTCTSFIFLNLTNDSGTDNSDYIIVDDIIVDSSFTPVTTKRFVNCTSDAFLSTPMRLQKIVGEVTATIQKGGTSALTPSSYYKYRYPRTPNILLSCMPPSGSSYPNGYTPYINTCSDQLIRVGIQSNNAVTENTALRVNWESFINEV